MPGWTDIYGLSEDAPEDKEGFDKSAEAIMKLVDAEKAKGISPKSIAIGGFSQGGAVALHVAMRIPEPIGAVIVGSSWLPLRDDYPASKGAGADATPFLLCHGDADQVVPHKWGLHSSDKLKELGIKSVTFETYNGMPHSACDAELDSMKDFLEKTLE